MIGIFCFFIYFVLGRVHFVLCCNQAVVLTWQLSHAYKGTADCLDTLVLWKLVNPGQEHNCPLQLHGPFLGFMGARHESLGLLKEMFDFWQVCPWNWCNLALRGGVSIILSQNFMLSPMSAVRCSWMLLSLLLLGCERKVLSMSWWRWWEASLRVEIGEGIHTSSFNEYVSPTRRPCKFLGPAKNCARR